MKTRSGVFSVPLRWCIVVTAYLALCGLSGCKGAPQVIDHHESFQAVEALWTAVTTRRVDLLEQTATELDRLKADGKLPAQGHIALTEIVSLSRKGEWKNAAISLKQLMRAQRKPTRPPQT